MVISCVTGFLLPVAFLLYFRIKKKADILPFFVGCAVMLLFAFVLESLVHRLILGSALGDTILKNTWIYALYGGFMAGLFEETGRFAAFKTVLRKYRDKDRNALMYGAGHGGLEALVILGITMINNILYAVLVNTGNTELITGPLTEEIRTQVESAFTALITTPSYQFLLASVERVLAIVLQISLSVLVWFAAKRKDSILLYPFAILLHLLVDAFVVILSDKGVSLLAVEGVVLVFAVCYAAIAKFVWKKHARTDGTLSL